MTQNSINPLHPGSSDLTERVIGAAIEVHRALGPGLMESMYEAALAIELTEREIPFQQQVPVHVLYKDQNIGTSRIDLVIASTLIVELKSVEALAAIHTAQLLTYLRTTGLRLGLLINFNVALLKDGIKRVSL